MNLHPVVLEHAADFLTRSPWEVSRDAGLLAEAHLAAWRYYGQSPVVCGIDVYHLEVEAWGATVERPAADAVPTLGPPPFSEPGALLDLPALDVRRDGRLPLTLAAALRLRAAGAEACAPMAGPVSIAVGLLGFEPFMIALLTHPEVTGNVLRHLAARQATLARQWLAAGVPTVVYESAGGPPLVSPEVFREQVAPALRMLFAAAPMPCILGGDTARIAGDLLAAGPTAVICPAETDQAAFLAAATARPRVGVRVNLPPAAWAAADWDAACSAMRRAAALAAGRPGTSLGTGVLPCGASPDCVRRAMREAERL